MITYSTYYTYTVSSLHTYHHIHTTVYTSLYILLPILLPIPIFNLLLHVGESSGSDEDTGTNGGANKKVRFALDENSESDGSHVDSRSY